MKKFYLYQSTGYTIMAEDIDEAFDKFMKMSSEEKDACMNESNHIEIDEEA